jgi:hypothetical protein
MATINPNNVVGLLTKLRMERDELSSAISVLERNLHHGQPQKPKPHGKIWTPAERKAMSEKMKKVAAARKKG